MEKKSQESVDNICSESPTPKRLSDSSQALFSRTSFTSKASNSQKRDSSIIHVDTNAYIDDASRTSSDNFNLGCIIFGNHRKEWKQGLRKRLDGVAFTLASITFTIMILYADLIRIAIAPPSLDPYFLAFTVTSIVIFTLEIVLSSLCRQGYVFRFYFWMDLVASFSLLCDIPSFVDMITFSSDDDNRHLTLERMAKAAQAGARSARIMQVISMVQLLRLRTKRLSDKRKNMRINRKLARSTTDSEGMDCELQFQMTSIKPQTRVGERLTEMTTRKVILGVLILLSMLPIFDSWVFYGYPTSFEDGGLLTLHSLYTKEGNSSTFLNSIEDYQIKNLYSIAGRKTGSLISLKVQNVTFIEFLEHANRLRKTEKQSSRLALDEDRFTITESWIDVKWDIQFQALLDIARVTFLLAVLSMGAILFIRDADELVLQPIERMVHKVKMLSENPLASRDFNFHIEDSEGGKQLETRILERSIGKVCQLLSVGFGEAGAEIISNNIKSTGNINPMLPGKKVEAIFGFCDVRNFTSATEVLQEEVMEFVNCIASVVHAEVTFHGGAANKNIGDAFLVVWKLPKTSEKNNRGSRGSIIDAKAALFDDAEENASSQVSRHLADAALASIVIIISSLQRSKRLKEFCSRGDVQERIPGFMASMGFGLHVGWAIEGAIGSHHKIDPSYLSPHVNMAARLEAATKQYGVPILLSESFVSLLSPQKQQLCRAIDTVMVKGSRVPTTLYTINASFDRTRDHLNINEAIFQREDNATETEGGHVSFSDYPYIDEYEEHPDILSINWLSSPKDDHILSSFNLAYNLYLDGKWSRSVNILESIQDPDGPSTALLQYMKSQGGICPPSWRGYRELTEK